MPLGQSVTHGPVDVPRSVPLDAAREEREADCGSSPSANERDRK
jgi:hypothetical protein